MARSAASAAARPLSIGPLALLVICGAGLLLVWCSYIFDVHAVTILLRDFGQTRLLTGFNFTLAEALAAGLNAAKIAISMVIAERIVARRWTLMPQVMRVLSFTLSLSLALVVFGAETISPNAKAAYDARLNELKAQHDTAISGLDTHLNGRATEVTATFQATRESEAKDAQDRIGAINAQLDTEREIGGQGFKGARYIELEAMAKTAKEGMVARTDTLNTAERSALDAISTQGETARKDIDEAWAKARDGIDLTKIAGEAEAQNPAIVAFARIAATLLGQAEVNPILITVALSVLTTLTLELLPMVLLTHAFRALGETREAGRAAAKAAVDQADALPEDAALADATEPTLAVTEEEATVTDLPRKPASPAPHPTPAPRPVHDPVPQPDREAA